jgi:nucleoside-diphosphate-sugar epimerase
VELLTGDRDDQAAFLALAARRFDAVIDMICFTPLQAEQTVRTFAGRVAHAVFCSTCCTYTVDVPPHVLVRESDPQRPVSTYGKNKLRCEEIFLAASAEGALPSTIVRPSTTYGPGSFLIDQLEFDTPAWGRIERGLPVLAAGDGLGLWQATHRRDVGKLFAGVLGESRTLGQSYNATGEGVITWRDYYRTVAGALGQRARVIFMPAGWIVRHAPERLGLLADTTRFHGAYDSSKARAHVPGFRCTTELGVGAAETIADIKRRGVFRDGRDDALYDAMVEQALAAGAEPETL